jgi:3-deoxy-D-manno-octulosonic acid (KDO) 8-phosphate synthase
MSAFDEHKEELEHYEQMMGAHRGRLAVSLDRLTNAMVLVGQHGVYCHSHRDPSKPTMDIQLITDELRKAKELIQSVMEELRMEREKRLRTT